jgi:hypothetical protein
MGELEFKNASSRGPAHFLQDFDVIDAYSRAQALEDGVLVDVSARAREAGFVYPVALTAALWADIRAIPPGQEGFQDVAGRLWDVLWMARMAIKRSPHGSGLLYQLIMPVGNFTEYTVQLVCGPGDHQEPVITLMREHED